MSTKADPIIERRITNAYAAFNAYEDATGCDPELSLYLLLRDLMLFARRECFQDLDDAIRIARDFV